MAAKTKAKKLSGMFIDASLVNFLAKSSVRIEIREWALGIRRNDPNIGVEVQCNALA